jgi:hypothetical protein
LSPHSAQKRAAEQKVFGEDTKIRSIVGRTSAGVPTSLRWLRSRSEDETVADVKKLIARGEADKPIQLIDRWI